VTAPAAPAIRGVDDVIAPGYRAIAHMRRGNDVDVYDAWSEERNSRCVIKELRSDRRAHKRARARLRAEGRLLLALQHPHIVRAYELVVRPDPVLVLETLQGETVSHLISGRTRRLEASEVAHLGLHLCSAISYIHRRGYLHIDLKPSNLIAECGQVKVIDFNLARQPGRARRGIGTPRYLAPEQALARRIGPPADLWGIGVVLYEGLTGSPAFPAGVRAALDDAPAGVWPPNGGISSLRRVPGQFAQTVEACLERNPADRPDIDELTQVLTRFASG